MLPKMNPTWELTGKRWAVQLPFAYPEVLTVHHFRTAKERDSWVAGDAGRRRAVGKRHDAVKSYRRTAVALWNSEKEVSP